MIPVALLLLQLTLWVLMSLLLHSNKLTLRDLQLSVQCYVLISVSQHLLLRVDFLMEEVNYLRYYMHLALIAPVVHS